MTKLNTNTRPIDNRRLLGLVIGRIFMPHLGIHLPAEGYGEIAMATLLAGEDDLVAVSAQPETIVVIVDGKRYRYTPDFRCEYRNPPGRVIEVRSQDRLDDELTRRKLDAAERHYARDDEVFERLPTQQLVRARRTLNQRILNRYARHPVTEAQRHAVRAALDAVTTMPLGMLARAVTESGSSKATLYRLLFDGELVGALDRDKVGDGFAVSWGGPCASSH